MDAVLFWWGRCPHTSEPRTGSAWRRAFRPTGDASLPPHPKPCGFARRQRRVASLSGSPRIPVTKALRDTKAFTPVGRLHENTCAALSNEQVTRVKDRMHGIAKILILLPRFSLDLLWQLQCLEGTAICLQVGLAIIACRAGLACHSFEQDRRLSSIPDFCDWFVRAEAEGFSCSRRETGKFSCRATRAFVTCATAKPVGLAQTPAARGEGAAFRPRDDGGCANRACAMPPRTVRGSGARGEPPQTRPDLVRKTPLISSSPPP